MVRPVTLHGKELGDWQELPPGLAVIVQYRMFALSMAGGWNDTVADPLPAVAASPVGGYGTPASTLIGLLACPLPDAFVATTRIEYVFPSVAPVVVQVSAEVVEQLVFKWLP